MRNAKASVMRRTARKGNLFVKNNSKTRKNKKVSEKFLREDSPPAFKKKLARQKDRLPPRLLPTGTTHNRVDGKKEE